MALSFRSTLLSRMATASCCCSCAVSPFFVGQSMLPTVATQAARNSRLAAGGVFVSELGDFTVGAFEAQPTRSMKAATVGNAYRSFVMGPPERLDGGVRLRTRPILFGTVCESSFIPVPTEFEQ